MALTKDQMARRAAAEFEPLTDEVDAADSLTLVTSFLHSELELLARRSSRSNVVVAGALQVSETGDLGTTSRIGDCRSESNDARNAGMGTHRLVVLMEHCEKDGAPRIVRTCALAVAGRGLVSRVLTELAAIDVSPEGLILREVAPGVSARDVQDHTEPTLMVGPDLKEM
jgi:3-oxoacid CoA-transferase subunit B